MKKIIGFLLFFNLIFIQNTFAKEEKTIFGFSLEFPSSKYVVLKEQNELTIKEFLKQNGYRDYKRIIRENEPKDLTTSDALKLLYKKQQDENDNEHGDGAAAVSYTQRCAGSGPGILEGQAGVSGWTSRGRRGRRAHQHRRGTSAVIGCRRRTGVAVIRLTTATPGQSQKCNA
jgi:hypothetical protein